MDNIEFRPDMADRAWNRTLPLMVISPATFPLFNVLDFYIKKKIHILMKKRQMILYFSSFTIDPSKIEQIDGENIILDEYNKIYYTFKNTKKGKADFVAFCRELEECYKLKIIGMGEYDGEGKTTIHVIYRKDIINILSKEIQIIINELGLNTGIVTEISNVLALEILKEIAIKRNLDMNLMFQYSSNTFMYFFVIDEKTRSKIIDLYQKNLNEYTSNIKCENSIMDRLRIIVKNNKKELTISIISGIIIETCMRILIVLLDTPHLDGGEVKVTKNDLLKEIYELIISKKPFSIEGVKKVSQMTELDIILLLNSLIEAKLVKKNYKDVFYGTGKRTLPNVLGKTEFLIDEIAEISSLFVPYNDQILSSNDDFNWKRTDLLSDLLKDLYSYSSSK